MDARGLSRIASDLFATMLLFREAAESNRPALHDLKSSVLGQLDTIAKAPEAQKLPDTEVEEARFALVAWVDEMVMTSDWSRREEWQRESLQFELFRTNRAGDDFYEHLSSLSPEQSAVREIYVLCLALGFEGQYRGHDADRRELIRQQVEMLRHQNWTLSIQEANPLAPPAYDLEIRLPARGRRRLWPPLLGWAVGALATFAVFWVVLYSAARTVPAPTGF